MAQRSCDFYFLFVFLRQNGMVVSDST